MSGFRKCADCGEYDWMDKHKCPPLWRVQIPEYEDGEWTRIYARTAALAAEKHAELFDSQGDYPIVDGPPVKVIVRSMSRPDVEVFEVEGETVPQYTANKL